jgi:hypothetical protein
MLDEEERKKRVRKEKRLLTRGAMILWRRRHFAAGGEATKRSYRRQMASLLGRTCESIILELYFSMTSLYLRTQFLYLYSHN